MRELTITETNITAGAVSQDTAIGTNMAIIGIGVAVGLTTTVAVTAALPIALIGVSAAVTGSYIQDVLDGDE